MHCQTKQITKRFWESSVQTVEKYQNYIFWINLREFNFVDDWYDPSEAVYIHREKVTEQFSDV